MLYIKKRGPDFSGPPIGGDYLLSHFRSTIGVVRLNFSVRNGKRWDPHAIITLVSFPALARDTQLCIVHYARPVMPMKPCDGNALRDRNSLSRGERATKRHTACALKLFSLAA